MKSYVLTTGIVFALLAVAHLMRVLAEGPALLRQPFFVVTTVVAIALAFWAVRLLRQK